MANATAVLSLDPRTAVLSHARLTVKKNKNQQPKTSKCLYYTADSISANATDIAIYLIQLTRLMGTNMWKGIMSIAPQSSRQQLESRMQGADDFPSATVGVLHSPLKHLGLVPARDRTGEEMDLRVYLLPLFQSIFPDCNAPRKERCPGYMRSSQLQ